MGCGVVVGLYGCGGVGGHFGAGGVDFTLSASPGSQAVTAGGFVAISVTINSTHGGLQIVRLSASGLPPGSTARFSDDVITSPGTTNLNILTGLNTPGGVSQITITRADLTGTQTSTASLTVTAAPPPPDFTLSAIPGTQLSLAGGTVSYGVKVSSSSSPTVNLSVTGQPAGASAGFDRPAIARTGTAVLTVSTAPGTILGAYDLVIRGVDSSGTRKVHVTLNLVPTDFVLTQQVGPVIVTAGGTVTGTLSVAPVAGSPGTENLSASGLAA